MRLDREALLTNPKSLVRRMVRQKARTLSRYPGFSSSDRDDLEQEFLVELLERWASYDPSQCKLVTFVRRTLDHKICKLLRDRKAQCRDFEREECSLNDFIPDGEGFLIERSQTLPEEALHRHRCVEQLSGQASLDLRLDLETVMAELPSELRELCELLPVYTLTEIAERLGRTRETLQEEISRLRNRFEAAGLSPSSSAS